MQESCVARRQSLIKTKFKEEGKIGGKSREEGDLPSCTSAPLSVNKDTFYGLFSVRINGVDSVADPGH